MCFHCFAVSLLSINELVHFKGSLYDVILVTQDIKKWKPFYLSVINVLWIHSFVTYSMLGNWMDTYSVKMLYFKWMSMANGIFVFKCFLFKSTRLLQHAIITVYLNFKHSGTYHTAAFTHLFAAQFNGASGRILFLIVIRSRIITFWNLFTFWPTPKSRFLGVLTRHLMDG